MCFISSLLCLGVSGSSLASGGTNYNTVLFDTEIRWFFSETTCVGIYEIVCKKRLEVISNRAEFLNL